MTLHHHLIDIPNKRIFPAEIEIADNKIISIKETDKLCEHYILPGFVDAHIHIESSMLLPSSFARIAVQHGTVATVSDPHEIANVCGIEGVKYMIENGKKVPFKFCFGAPSCVPATSFETAGDEINAAAIEQLMQDDDIYYLSEMMNYPGVLFDDEEIYKKIASAKKYNKPVDGHAPNVRGKDAKKYIAAGISTDHECTTLEEAAEKLSYGMKILIREGSAAKNFEALIDLLHNHPTEMMFCCDDKHPDELLLYHINHHVKKALALGVNLFNVLQAACINPVKHYKLPVGLLQVNDPADFIVVNNTTDFNILKTCINGQFVFENNESKIAHINELPINKFDCEAIAIKDIEVNYSNEETIKVIACFDGQLITKTHHAKPLVINNKIVTDVENDILKIVVVNRYCKAKPAISFIKNFNFTQGAIASTVAHDSHNIIAVGLDDESICKAINSLVEVKGGISVVKNHVITTMPLHVAGLMSTEDAVTVGKKYSELDSLAKSLGSNLNAPFMTLSFMALLVIPQLKLSDKGLFDGDKFTFV
jgi:adenine deaminase